MLLRQEGDRFVFRFERPEREMFSQILDLFPAQKGSMRPIGGKEEAQKILEQALDEQRGKLREESRRLLRKQGSLAIDKEFNEFWDLSISAEELEWLLQMLNDVRVGLWVDLGCPNPNFPPDQMGPPTEEMLRSNVIMQLCAMWQGILMAAVDVRGETEAEGE